MWGTIALAGLGALAGSQADTQTSSMQLRPPSEAEIMGGKAITDNLPGLQALVNAGPGQTAQANANAANTQYADLLQKFSQGGYMPTQADFATAGQFAQSAFAPQQTAINQQFDEEKLRASQLAAQLGRPVNDPIIQAKLSQERMRAQERLGASQSAFTSEFALSQPQQRLGYTAQLADIQQGLASQAMANRQALIGLGSQIQGQGQSFRAATAQRSQTTSGGGLAGAISGGLAGFGAGMSAFGGGGGGQSSPLAQGVGSALGSYMGTSSSSSGGGYNLGGNYDFSAPSLSAAAPGLKSQLANFGAPTSTSGQGYNYQFHSVPPAPSFQYNGQFGPQVNPSVPFWQR